MINIVIATGIGFMIGILAGICLMAIIITGREDWIWLN